MPACDFLDPRVEEGLRLFNAGEFFACHDVLEDFWGEQTGPEARLFQGLIQAAVALFHFEEGNLGGARRMVVSASAYLRPFAPQTGGIDVQQLLTDLEFCFEELCRPWEQYPSHLRINPERIPRIRYSLCASPGEQ